MQEFSAYCARKRWGKRRAQDLRSLCREAQDLARWTLAPVTPWYGVPLRNIWGIEAPQCPERDGAVAALRDAILSSSANSRKRKRTRQEPITKESFLRNVEGMLGAWHAAALRAVAPWSSRSRGLRIPVRRVKICRAPHMIFVHDGAGGTLARCLRSFVPAVPFSIDVAVPPCLVQDFLRQWRFVYPETRLCEYEDGRVGSEEHTRRASSGDRSGVRLWSAADFMRCRDKNDVLVVEELQDWPPQLEGLLAELKVRVVVVGCPGICSRVRNMLPYLSQWSREVFDARLHYARQRRRPAREGRVVEPDLCFPLPLAPSSQYVRWAAVLADGLLRELIRAPGTARVSYFWKAFRSAIAYTECTLRSPQDSALFTGPWEATRDRDLLSFLSRWTTRAALLAYAASSSHTKEQARSKAARMGAVFGDCLWQVCPKCLSSGHQSSCDWDLQAETSGEVARILDAAGASDVSRYVSRFKPSRALFAQKVFREARDMYITGQSPLQRGTRAATREAAFLLLRSWARSLELERGEELRDEVLDHAFLVYFEGKRGGSLHLRGSSAMSKYSGYGRRARVLGAPVVNGRGFDLSVDPLPPDAMADSLSLRTFTAHMARTHHIVVRAAHPLLLDFLGVNWCIVAGHEALLRWSFRNEITEVCIHPSFLLSREARARLKRVRFCWPNAQIFWHAAVNCPTAFAMEMLFE